MMTQGVSCAATSLQTGGSFSSIVAAFNGKPSKGLDFRMRFAYETDAGMLEILLLLIFARKIIPWFEPNFRLAVSFYIQIE
jgi:hypothetical protein